MTVIETDAAPAAVGTYSQGHSVDGRIVTAGQIGLEPDTGDLREGNFLTEARRALANVLAIVRAGGGNAGTVVKTTVFLTDLGDYDQLNTLYEETFQPPYPARSVVEVGSIPRGARVEIEAEATVPGE